MRDSIRVDALVGEDEDEVGGGGVLEGVVKVRGRGWTFWIWVKVDGRKEKRRRENITY